LLAHICGRHASEEVNYFTSPAALTLVNRLNFVVYTVASISPGLDYNVPAGHGNDSCTCSTVTYSVVAACALCQGALAGK
jgi:hypothetical protein